MAEGWGGVRGWRGERSSPSAVFERRMRVSVRPAAVSPTWFSSRGACDLRCRRRSSPAKGQRRIMRRNNSSDEEPGSPAPPGGQQRDGGGGGVDPES